MAAHYVITESRKLTAEELAKIESFEIVPYKYYGKAVMFTISDLDEPRYIPLFSYDDAANLSTNKEGLYLVTLKSVMLPEVTLLRISSENQPLGDLEAERKKYHLEKKVRNCTGGLFSHLVLY